MNEKNKHWTVVEILKTTSDYFHQKQFENPRLNAELLLCHVLKIERVQLYLQFDRRLLQGELSEYRELVRRRSQNEPLQYLTGHTEFMGLPFEVSSSVLIPRPETELLVETALEILVGMEKNPVQIWDIGTGSGCIAISIAAQCRNCELLATDISEQALHLAEKNADRNRVDGRIRFEVHDVLNDPVPNGVEVDMLVSNPPYVTAEEYDGLQPEIVKFEPKLAVTDFGDGLVFYRRIFSLLEKLATCKLALIELSGTRPDPILELMSKTGLQQFEIKNDLNDRPRILIIRK